MSLKVRVHRNLWLVPARSQINPVTTTELYFFCRSVLIFSSHLWLGIQNDLFPLLFLTKILYAVLISHMWYMLHLSCHSLFERLKKVWWRVVKCSMSSSSFFLFPLPCLFPNILFSIPFSDPLSVNFSFSVNDIYVKSC